MMKRLMKGTLWRALKKERKNNYKSFSGQRPLKMCLEFKRHEH